MRILSLSEIPEDWREAVFHWKALNSEHMKRRGRPSASHEYMLYQALIGAWSHEGPDEEFAERMQLCALKAAREGKQQTSWTNPDGEYEKALVEFVRAILNPPQSAEFIASFAEFADRTALLGALNGLSQLALKVLLPGVPDFFQGTELWDTSLVDPDNRRPVDYDRRRALLSTNPITLPSDDWRSGRKKFWLMRELLHIRNSYADVLSNGRYQSVAVEGKHSENVIAFARQKGRQRLYVLVGRHFSRLTNGGRHWPSVWDGRLCAPGKLHDLLNDRPAATDLASLFSGLPVAILRN
jgi:(1->4)-alpha-D-glucan 1-alpha-D-glucosylmutase